MEQYRVKSKYAAHGAVTLGTALNIWLILLCAIICDWI